MDLVSLLQPPANSPDGDRALNIRGTLSAGHRHSWDNLNYVELQAQIFSKSIHLGVYSILTFLLLLRFFIRQRQEAKLYLWLSG